MNKKSIIIQDMSPENLSSFIHKSINYQFKDLIKQLTIKQESETLLTRAEACKILKIDSSTLWNWTKKGKIQAYGIMNRRYYKLNEIMESLTPLKVSNE